MRAPLLFFTAVALLIICKNAGIRPFLWLGTLPLFDQVWSLRWAGPVWTFSLAVGAAFGLQTIMPARLDSIPSARLRVESKGVMAPRPFFLKISKSLENGPRIAPVMAFVIISVVYAAFLAMPTIMLPLSADEIFNSSLAPFAMPSIGGATLVFVFTLILMLFVTLRFLSINKGLAAIVALAALELWWGVPRGYAPDFLTYKWFLFAEGLLIVFFLRKEWTVTAALMALVFIASLWYIDGESPRGWPERRDPFKEAPYVKFIKSLDAGEGFRTVGAYGVLMPNYASTVGLRDLRYVNSLISKEFQEFRTSKLHASAIEEEPVSSLWFTGMAERCAVVRRPGGGASYRAFYRPVEDDFKGEPLVAYSLFGVRYVVVPPNVSLPAPLKRIYNGEVRVYENPGAKKRARLEGRGGKSIGGTATIKEDGASRVVIDVESASEARLILGDIYYPGWKATINGAPVEIGRAHGVMRSVAVGKGRSEVIFTYHPTSFSLGLLLSAIGLLVCAGLRLKSKRQL